MLGQNRGQVTIFIIIAVLIVGVALLIFFLRPGAQVSTAFDEQNPSAFLQTCLEEEITNAIETVSLQGGDLEPEHFIAYQDSNIQYLCYTDENYAPCVVQQVLLKDHIEDEIREEIQPEVTNCFNELRENYVERNYNVDLQTGSTNVELLPKRVVSSFDYILTVTRGDTERYDSFNVVLDNNLYELVSIANSIVEWEATYGDVETSTYMTYYRDLKVEKKNQNDGSTIYILTDRNNGNKFQFASRSVVWPPGYGADGIANFN